MARLSFSSDSPAINLLQQRTSLIESRIRETLFEAGDFVVRTARVAGNKGVESIAEKTGQHARNEIAAIEHSPRQMDVIGKRLVDRPQLR